MEVEYEQVRLLAMLTVPVQVGVVVVIIWEGLLEDGFQYGNSTLIYPLVLNALVNVNDTVIVTPLAPTTRLLGVIEADASTAGVNPLRLPVV